MDRTADFLTSAKAVGLLLALLLSACTTAAPPPPRAPEREAPSELVERDGGYLLDPLSGWAEPVAPEAVARLGAAHRGMLAEAEGAGRARQVAAELLVADPALAPAEVLAAQADFAAGDFAAVIGRLVPVGDRMPGYVASQLLLGRAAELAGDLPLAYSAYRAVAAKSPLAFERTGEIHPRAVEIVDNRFEEALDDRRLDEAERHLRLLADWAPAEAATHEAARALAVARGDRRGELMAVKNLSERQPDDRALRERRAELELEVGDPGAGLEIIQELARQDPRDRELAAKLEAARFRWRLSLLPAGVQEVAARPELNRAELAVLLYWLVPDVRYTRAAEGRIATDVLDHPQREEIVRVVNLGLLDVDELHRFAPRSLARRSIGLRSLLRLLSRFGKDLQCMAGAPAQPAQSRLCELTASCGLLDGEDGCRPGDPLSGPDAVELIRRSLKLLGRS